MSSTDVWSYVPQRVLEETHHMGGVLTSDIGPRSDLSGTNAEPVDQVRFRLEYPTICTTAEVNSMLAFYDARLGSYESFKFVNPNDTLSYTVRFDSDLTAEYATAGAWGVRTIVFQSIGSITPLEAAFGASTPTTTDSGGFVKGDTGIQGFQTHRIG